jgi:hypothetical protein
MALRIVSGEVELEEPATSLGARDRPLDKAREDSARLGTVEVAVTTNV